MCSLFADDHLVYRKIESESNIEILQNDLANLELWTKECLMTFNTDKCEVTQISLKPVTPNSYTLYGRHLKAVTKAKYLGVMIDCKLSFTKHYYVKRQILCWHLFGKTSSPVNAK